MKKVFIFVCIVFTLLSCDKSSYDYNHVDEDAVLSSTIPLSEALSSLDSMIKSLKPEVKCDYDEHRSVSLVGALDFTSTKAAGFDIPDTLMYIVNFDGGNGFAVLAGDRRLGESVYCLTEEGIMTPEDFSKAFDYLHTRYNQTKVIDGNFGDFKDMGTDFVPALLLSSMLADLKYGLPENETIGTKTTLGTTNGVLLKTKWHQMYPFNAYTPVVDGVNCPTGCVATACAQIMQYCKKPSNPKFNDMQCSWSEMGTVCSTNNISGSSATSSAKEQVGKFLSHIGKKSLCYIRYDKTASGGYAAGVVRTLEYYGYSSVKKYTGFGTSNQAKASEMLRKGLPVYLDGSDWSNGGGHAWVIDGEWNGHFHCNWGWNGKWDGYYAKHNYFPIKNRAYIDSSDPDTMDNSLKDKNYDWNFRLITYSK